MSQRSRVLPGFGLSLGFTLAYVSFIVLIPLSAVFIKSFGIGWDGLWEILTSERILKSLQLSFSAALIAATVNVIFGLLLAWCLVRYSFPGKRIVDALVDLPFALPTAVAGIALVLGGVGIYKIYDYELVEIQESTITNNLTQSSIYFATATNNNKLFYNYITSKAVVVFEAETTPYTYDLNGINLTETLNCITEPQLKSVLAEISGCDCCGEEGTFGEDSSYILQGDAPNTYIDANGQPISI